MADLERYEIKYSREISLRKEYNRVYFNARKIKLSLSDDIVSRQDANGNECFSSASALSTIRRVIRSAFSFEDRVRREWRLSGYDESIVILNALSRFFFFFFTTYVVSILVRWKSLSSNHRPLLNLVVRVDVARAFFIGYRLEHT